MEDLNQNDFKFVKEIEFILDEFLKTKSSEKKLEPMNSYQRRLVHKICSLYKINSNSSGNKENRYVVIKKQDTSKKPNLKFKAILIDKGNEIYYAKPGINIVLRYDGSFGIQLNESKNNYIHKRVIHDGIFRIKSNQIVCQGDSNW